MRILSFIFVIISFSNCSYAEVYKCKTQEERVYYQSTPCKNDKGETLGLQKSNSKEKLDELLDEYLDPSTKDELAKLEKYLERLKAAPPIEFKSIKIDKISDVKNIFEQSKPNIGSNLKDPSSVMYRDVKAIKVEYFKKEYTYFCGEVNAKNSYGGYNGYKQFFSDGTNLQIGRESFTPSIEIGDTLYKFGPIINYCFLNGESL